MQNNARLYVPSNTKVNFNTLNSQLDPPVYLKSWLDLLT